MCEICDIVLILEVENERKSKIRFVLTDWDIVFKILYLLSSSAPSISISLTANADLHSILERRIAFDKIQNIKFYPTLSLLIFHAKEKPLSTSCSIYVLLQQEVVLSLGFTFYCES